MGSTSLLTRQVHRGARAGQRDGALSSVFVKTPDPRDFFGRPKAVSPVNESTCRKRASNPFATILQGMKGWRQWVDHPERSWLRNMIFQIHMWVGAGVSVYVLLMSISGSIIVWQNELSKSASVEWLV